MLKLLLIDNEEKYHKELISCLPIDFTFVIANSVDAGYKFIESLNPDIILLDIKLENAITFIEHHCCTFFSAPVILFTKEKNLNIIIQSIQLGAADYIHKDLNFSNIIEKIIFIHETASYTQFYNGRTPDESPLNFIIGDSKEIKKIKTTILRYAENDFPVFITGESGTGKELVAKGIHQTSARKDEVFTPINCGAIPSNLLEAELFGSEKGAFTDAVTKAGSFEISRGGSVFLDEIGEMPPQAQVKLLRVLEEKKIQRLGSSKQRSLDIRIISATNIDISDHIDKKSFRKDLYYRLNLLHIHTPALRTRLDDIPLLTEHFLQQNSFKKTISPQSMQKLYNHSWPGNIRELRNVIIRASLLSGNDKIHSRHIQFF